MYNSPDNPSPAAFYDERSRFIEMLLHDHALGIELGNTCQSASWFKGELFKLPRLRSVTVDKGFRYEGEGFAIEIGRQEFCSNPSFPDDKKLWKLRCPLFKIEGVELLGLYLIDLEQWNLNRLGREYIVPLRMRVGQFYDACLADGASGEALEPVFLRYLEVK